MNDDFSYDPVTAIDERSARGETAELFADIRATMAIPLVTSIWRGLAGMDDALAQVWRLTKPVYLSGMPQRALARCIAQTPLPAPPPLSTAQLASVGLSDTDVDAARTIIAAYNRSNGMNLMALSALVTPPAEHDDADTVAFERLRQPSWPPFPELLAQTEIAATTWSMVREVNAFGAASSDANVATLWRHLAHWPALLALIHASFATHQRDGSIRVATNSMVALARAGGARMAHLRPAQLHISPAAHTTISGYVSTTTQVVRMVTMGHALAAWLASGRTS
jgi:hypothetical protein